MNKKLVIGSMAVFVVAIIVAVASFFIINNTTEPEEPTGEPTSETTPEEDPVPTEDPNDTPEPIDTSDAAMPTSPEYWNGESEPGLCAAMQEWYLEDVQPLTYGEAGYGDLEEKLIPAAEEARSIIDENDADAETKEIFTNLADSVEYYGKYMGDPSVPQQQLLQVVSDHMEYSETAKMHCGW